MRWCIILIWGLLIFSTLGFSPPNQNNDDIKLEIRAGYDGHYRAGQWLPLQVSVENSGPDLIGTLQVRTETAAETTEKIYRTPITVARDTPKTIFLNIALENQRPTIVVELLDSEGRVVKSQSETLRQVRTIDILQVVVTESVTGTVDVTRREIGSGQIYQVNWSVRDIPAEAEALRAVDVLMFFDIRNARLTSEQQMALDMWVQGGGHLIIHGGPGWQFAQDFLNDLLPTDLEGIRTVGSLSALGKYLGRPSEALEAVTEDGYIITRNTPRPGSEVLLTVEGEPLIVRKHFGAGTVDFVGADPLTAPLADYSDTNAIWFHLIATGPPRPSWGYDLTDWDSANNAIRIVTGFSLPSALQMLGFLSLYVMLIGPLNYIVLWRLGRRELAWFTIPALILAFTVIAYFTGFSLRGNAATVNHLAVVQVWPDSDMARVDGLVGVFSPRRTTYDLGVDEDLTLRTIPGIRDVDSGIVGVPVVQDGNYHVADLPVDAGIVASFTTSGYIPAPQIDGEATWTLTETGNVSLSGLVTNTQPFALKDVVILAKDGFAVIGDLESGQSDDFKVVIEVLEPTLLPLGNRRDYSDTPFRTFSGRPGRSGTNVPVNVYSCEAGGYNAMMAQVLYGQEYDCGAWGGSDDDRTSRRRALLLASISNEFDYSGGRAGDVYMVGWAEAPAFDVQLEGTDQVNRYETLYIFKLPVDFHTDPAAAEPIIPPGFMTWTLVDNENQFSSASTPYGLFVTGNEQVTFLFVPVADLQSERVVRLELLVDVAGSNNMLDLLIWNWDQGQWMLADLTFDQNLLRLNRPSAYLGPNNEILVQIQASDIAEEVSLQLLEPTMYIE